MGGTNGCVMIIKTPVVITLYQRSGPSTGLRHGQDDHVRSSCRARGIPTSCSMHHGDVESTIRQNVVNYVNAL